MPNLSDAPEAARTLFHASLALLNDLEEVAYARPGVSGSVLSDWVAGIPLGTGFDTDLLPEDAALGQAIEALRGLSKRLGLLVGQVDNAAGIHSRV